MCIFLFFFEGLLSKGGFVFFCRTQKSTPPISAGKPSPKTPVRSGALRGVASCERRRRRRAALPGAALCAAGRRAGALREGPSAVGSLRCLGRGGFLGRVTQRGRRNGTSLFSSSSLGVPCFWQSPRPAHPHIPYFSQRSHARTPARSFSRLGSTRLRLRQPHRFHRSTGRPGQPRVPLHQVGEPAGAILKLNRVEDLVARHAVPSFLSLAL